MSGRARRPSHRVSEEAAVSPRAADCGHPARRIGGLLNPGTAVPGFWRDCAAHPSPVASPTTPASRSSVL